MASLAAAIAAATSAAFAAAALALVKCKVALPGYGPYAGKRAAAGPGVNKLIKQRMKFMNNFLDFN